MSSNITNISHGQANWDTTVNNNFSNLDSDTGYISVPLLAPFVGNVRFRKRSQVIEINGNFRSEEDIELGLGVTIAILPTNTIVGAHLSNYFIAFADGSTGYTRMALSPQGELKIFGSTIDTKTYETRFFTTTII